jgi:cytochrome c oxidase cbb3-type subunit 4
METYSFLRHLADSWFLLAMTLGFVGLCFWAYRPGSRPVHQDAANSIFRNDARPAEANPARKEA